MPGIPSSEKEQLEKSLRYNLWASLIRFIVLNFVLTCVWFFGFGLGFDAIKAATGQQLKGTMTVTGVVQEDGLTLSVKDPNKGKHVVYSLTDLGVCSKNARNTRVEAAAKDSAKTSFFKLVLVSPLP